ncbi:MAG: hypothetical protein R3B13_39630 [Polyangiaceae bacterium]
MTIALRRLGAGFAFAAFVACGGGDSGDANPSTLQDLSIADVVPTTLVPGTRLVVEGSFGDVTLPILELTGSFDGQDVKLTLPADIVSGSRVELAWNGGVAQGLPSDTGTFDGIVRVLATGPIDGRSHTSLSHPVTLKVATSLTPKFYGVFEGSIFVNDYIGVDGDQMLLGGAEGKSVALIEGCFTKLGSSTCEPIADVEIPMRPRSEFARDKAEFPFAPKIVGIEQGNFKGTVRIRNDAADGSSSIETQQIPVDFDLLKPTVLGFSPAAASLGQFVDVTGGGFVGPSKEVEDPTSAVTTIRLEGSFTAAGGSTGVAVSVDVVPQFFDGRLVRYVLNEEDALGKLADLRTVTGTFKGNATPLVRYGAVNVTGTPAPFTLGIAPIKQVVWVQFLPTFVESLRHFGLRAVEKQVRERVLTVMARDYKGVNVEFRDSEPTDFALYARVDIAGPDPNGLGLLGYDNTPGKDKGNKRLHDRIGGVNAVTQEDNQPGYGGVFVESMFGFSAHPGVFAEKLEVSDPLFDLTFDPFRPDRKGKPVLAEDLATLDIPTLSESSRCPATGRADRIACAIWVLGSLIGTTTSHEIAHSLGLADPYGSLTSYHNPSDEPNRLMDSGGARTFPERAELDGQGPAVFCDEEYQYLQEILPLGEPDPVASRPGCF